MFVFLVYAQLSILLFKIIEKMQEISNGLLILVEGEGIYFIKRAYLGGRHKIP